LVVYVRVYCREDYMHVGMRECIYTPHTHTHTHAYTHRMAKSAHTMDTYEGRCPCFHELR